MIPGDNSGKVTVDVVCNLVLPNEDGTFSNPSATIAIYAGDIANSQSFIEMANQYNWFGELDLPEGQTEWTEATLVAAMEEKGINVWELMGTVLNDSEYSNEITVESTFNPETGELEWKVSIDGAILTITGLGTESEMYELFTQYKLHKTNGEDKNAEDIPNDDPPGPDPGPGGGPGGGGGPWSDAGIASVSASVFSYQYDVSTAIPTSENVHGTISASDMSWYYNVTKESATVSWEFTANLYWHYTWKWVTPGYTDSKTGKFIATGSPYKHWYYANSASEKVTGQYTTHFFVVQRAEMNTLSGGSVTNPTTGVIASVGSVDLAGSIVECGNVYLNEGKLNKGPVSGYATENSRAAARASAKAAADLRVKQASFAQNDILTIKSGVLGGKTEYGEEFKATPYESPSYLVSPSSSTKSGSGVKMIPEDKANGNYPSSASATYQQKGGFHGQPTYSKGAGAPSVFVWTPVVNESYIVSEPFVNQKVVQESGLKYLQLDKKLVVNIPRAGTHTGNRGYGTRDYNSYQAVPQKASNWGKVKDVKLPFDAYLQPSNTLIKAGKWLSDYGLATTQESYTFLIPVWSQEAKGTIETRVVAENISSYSNGSSASTGLIQDTANLDWTKYIAEKKIPVEVIGKIYDLRISSTNDPGWPGIKGEGGKPYVSSPEFPFGQKNQNAMPQYQFAPKLGYLVEFDFKTKGVKTDNVDVSIQPEGFYFISKNGGNAEKVDLYFKTVTNQYVKIDPSSNTSDIIVNLSNPFMKVAKSEIIDSTRIMKQQVQVVYTYVQDVLIGKLPSLNIPEKLRLCYNNFTEYATEYPTKLYGKPEAAIANDANGGLSYSTGKYDKVNNGRDTVIASVGHWYAAYRLPSSTVAVKPGTTAKQIMTNPNVIKKNGYILVKFDIVGKNGAEDYLRYTGPESIMEPGTFEDDRKWQDPSGNPDPTNPNQPVQLPNNKPGTIPDGTVILFETDWRANNDSEVIGTH